MFYVLIAFLFLSYLLNELSKKYSLTHLYYKRALSSKAVEVDEKFEITTIIENNKLLPVTFLQVIEKFPVELEYKLNADVRHTAQYTYHCATMMLMPKQRVKRTYGVSLTKRGSYLLSSATIVAGDLLGFSTMSMEQEFMQEVVVYPRRIELEEEFKPTGSYFGDISVRRWIINDPVLTVGVREYTGMEPQKNIHWPSSLKNGRLMVRSFDFTTDNDVALVLNLECGKPFWFNIDIDAIEKCLSTTRTIVDELEQMGVPYGITTNVQYEGLSPGSFSMKTGFGEAHYSNVLQLLGKANYGISAGFEEVVESILRNPNKSMSYIFITPVVLSEYLEAINELSKGRSKIIMLVLNSDNLVNLDEIITIYKRRGLENEGNSQY